MDLPWPIIAADTHVAEPPDLWQRHLPDTLAHLGPRVEVHQGAVSLVVEERLVRRFGPRLANAAAATVAEQAMLTELVSLGAREPDARLADLDRDGVWGEVMYPNLAFFCIHLMRHAQAQAACCRIYNDWLAETFLGVSPRFCPVAILPMLEVADACAELERAAELGFHAALLPCHVDHRPYNDPAYEPLWARAADLGLPFTFHAGTGRSQTPAHGAGAAVINYVVTVGSGPMETVAYLCASGILARHPRLQVVIVESGSGWLAWALHAMDDAYHSHHMFVRPKLEQPPSFYFKRQGALTFQDDPVGLANLAFSGDACLMWGSDYPHPEGTWPDSQASLKRQLQGVEPATARRILVENAARIYRFPLPPQQQALHA